MSLPDHIVVTPTYTGDIQHGRGCFAVVGCPTICMARHLSLAGALAHHAGRPQFWLDDDVVVTDADIAEMFAVQQETGAGVVIGWYPIRGDKLRISGNQKPGGNHGRWSEVTTFGTGCVLIMPWVWDAFPYESWMITDDGNECPPAFVSRPMWDRLVTTEDFDFAMTLKDHGIRIVSANRVSAAHAGRRIPPKLLEQILQAATRLPTVSWCSNLAAATQAATDLVVVGSNPAPASLLDEVALWCVDMGHPARSQRFGSAVVDGWEIFTPRTARWRYFGVANKRWTINFPSGSRQLIRESNQKAA
jgi:hypothetical protein